MKHSLKLFWLLLGLSCSAAACEKTAPERVEAVRISFEVPLAIAPARAAYALGDTLWLHADFSDSVQVFNGPGRHQLRPAQFDFKTVVSFQEFVSPSRTLAEQPGAGGRLSWSAGWVPSASRAARHPAWILRTRTGATARAWA